MKQIHEELVGMIGSAERQAMSPHERSLKVVMEMAELLSIENESGIVAGNTLGSNNPENSSFLSHKSTAELTVSTAASASTEASPFHSPPSIPFCSEYGKDQ
jgi:hypothetical protein